MVKRWRASWLVYRAVRRGEAVADPALRERAVAVAARRTDRRSSWRDRRWWLFSAACLTLLAVVNALRGTTTGYTVAGIGVIAVAIGIVNYMRWPIWEERAQRAMRANREPHV
jgi:hypothetical protein